MSKILELFKQYAGVGARSKQAGEQHSYIALNQEKQWAIQCGHDWLTESDLQDILSDPFLSTSAELVASYSRMLQELKLGIVEVKEYQWP